MITSGYVLLLDQGFKGRPRDIGLINVSNGPQ